MTWKHLVGLICGAFAVALVAVAQSPFAPTTGEVIALGALGALTGLAVGFWLLRRFGG